MSEADLMILPGPIHLGCEPVGNPEIGTMFAQELFDHGPAAVGMDDEAGVLGVVEPRACSYFVPGVKELFSAAAGAPRRRNCRQIRGVEPHQSFGGNHER